MTPDPRFLHKPSQFWAAVRLISDLIGYSHGKLTVAATAEALQTVEANLSVKALEAIPEPFRIIIRGNRRILSHRGPLGTAARDMLLAIDPAARKGWAKAVNSLFERSRRRSWVDANLLLREGSPTPLGELVCAYLNFRQQRLSQIEPCLMTKSDAEAAFNEVRHRLGSHLDVPMNKQTGGKSGPAYLTGIVHMLIEARIGELACDYDPQSLTTFVRNGEPISTLSRRMDGAFPSTVNPIAVWEIKEYYNSESFGSRVAGGVYETVLDGMELTQLRNAEGMACAHYVFVDDRHTWWDQGRSYLCRFVDALHMGYADEILFGTEAILRVPQLAKEWVDRFRARLAAAAQ